MSNSNSPQGWPGWLSCFLQLWTAPFSQQVAGSVLLRVLPRPALAHLLRGDFLDKVLLNSCSASAQSTTIIDSETTENDVTRCMTRS
jgi:hypothetical protein